MSVAASSQGQACATTASRARNSSGVSVRCCVGGGGGTAVAVAGRAGARAGDRADVDDERSSAHSASKASKPSEPASLVAFFDAALGSARDHMNAICSNYFNA